MSKAGYKPQMIHANSVSCCEVKPKRNIAMEILHFASKFSKLSMKADKRMQDFVFLKIIKSN